MVKTYKFRVITQLQQAVQWVGNMEAIIELLGHDLPTFGEGKDGSLRMGDDIEVRPGDWVMKLPSGATCAVDNDVFENHYEEA